tara:strand:+ start:424 stop:552 length:129 start_codon:yes stop_codon:yes gene_type:complete
MCSFIKKIKNLPSLLVKKGKEVERERAGRKWDSIVEELKKRK